MLIAKHDNPTPTIQEQLCLLNKYWQAVDIQNPILQKRTLISDWENLIQLHLELVENHLRNKDVSYLSLDQQEKRLAGLDILKDYWQEGRFPQNTQHPNQIIPYFIDDFNTACAVGHILRETGGNELAEKIKRENNYAYIEDMEYGELLEWAEEFGFEEEELRWIQPGYFCIDEEFVDIHVTSTADSGEGSLRNAIEQANNFGGAVHIKFDLPGNNPVIFISTHLPWILSECTIIDGFTQSGGYVTIDGSNAQFTGTYWTLVVNADDVQIRGLYFRNVPPDFSAAMGAFQKSNIYFIGNILTGNHSGISAAEGSTHIIIENNIIGLNPAQNSATGNHYGIEISDGASIIITGNTIAGNEDTGIVIQNSEDISISNNKIGTNLSENLFFPQDTTGVWIGNSSNIGIDNNTIYGNEISSWGIYAVNSEEISIGTSSVNGKNQILNNYVGVSKLNTNGFHVGINEFVCNEFPIWFSDQNFIPEIPSILNASTSEVSGTGPTNSSIDLYINDNSNCNVSSCQGREFIGSVQSNNAGNWTYAGSISPNTSITTLATQNGNTSNFADCQLVQNGGGNNLNCADAIPLTVNQTYQGDFDMDFQNYPYDYNCGSGDPQFDFFSLHEFTASETGTHTVEFTEGVQFVAFSVFVLTDCDENSCIAGEFVPFSFDFEAINGQNYYVVVIASGTEFIPDGNGGYEITIRNDNQGGGDLNCEDAISIICGITYSSNTFDAENNISQYGCSTWDESGKEVVYKVETTEPGNLTASLSSLGSGVDLDVFILNSSCDANQCLAVGNFTAVYENAPPGIYYIVVDGFEGDEGFFDLTVNCSGNELPNCPNDVLSLSWVQDLIAELPCHGDATDGCFSSVSTANLNGSVVILANYSCSENGLFGASSNDIYDCEGNLLQDCEGFSFSFSCTPEADFPLTNEEVIWTCEPNSDVCSTPNNPATFQKGHSYLDIRWEHDLLNCPDYSDTEGLSYEKRWREVGGNWNTHIDEGTYPGFDNPGACGCPTTLEIPPPHPTMFLNQLKPCTNYEFQIRWIVIVYDQNNNPQVLEEGDWTPIYLESTTTCDNLYFGASCYSVPALTPCAQINRYEFGGVVSGNPDDTAECDFTFGDHGYDYEESLTANVQRGNSETLEYAVLHSDRMNLDGNTLNFRLKVWIDFNQDNDYEDAGELVLNDVNTTTINSSLLLSENIAIPETAALGTTRMRLTLVTGNHLGGNVENPSSCENYSTGHTREINVNIVESIDVPDCQLSSEDILCQPWLEQAINNIPGNICEDNNPNTIINVELYDLNGSTIVGVTEFETSSESGITYLFDCEGNSLGECNIGGFTGFLCFPATLEEIQFISTIWTCGEELCEPQDCPNGEPLTWSWVQDYIANIDCFARCPQYIESYTYQGETIISIYTDGGCAPLLDLPRFDIYDCHGNLLFEDSDPAILEVSNQQLVYQCPPFPDCSDDILCEDWLQMAANFSNNSACIDGDENTQFEIRRFTASRGNIIGLSTYEITGGISPEGITDFYYCDGEYIGSCPITDVAGLCTPDFLNDIIYFDEIIWDCSQAPPCGSTPPWSEACQSIFPNFHTICILPDFINDISDIDFNAGDFVAACYLDDNGNEIVSSYMAWEDDGSTPCFTVCGDNPNTSEKDGFISGEPFIIKVWDAETGEIITVTATYQPTDPSGGNPTAEGNFAGLGRSHIIALETPSITEPPYCGNIIPISCGQIVQGNNQTDGQSSSVAYGTCNDKLYNGHDVFYEFTINSQQDVVITLTPENSDLDLLLLSECDRHSCIAVSDKGLLSPDVIYYPDLASGSYVIVVEGYIGNASNYTLELECGNITNGPLNCNAVTDLTCNATLSNQSNSNGTNNVIQYSCNETYSSGPERVYRWVSDAHYEVKIYLRNLSADLDLFLLDDCNENTCITASTRAETEEEAIIFEAFTNREYFIVVDGFNGSVGTYDLAMSCLEYIPCTDPPCPSPGPNLDCNNATSIECGQRLAASNIGLAANEDVYGCENGFNSGPEAVFEFYNPVLQDVTIEVTGIEVGEDLDLYLLSDCNVSNCLGYVRKDQNQDEAMVKEALQEGTYYIVVDGYNGSQSDFFIQVSCSETEVNCHTIELEEGDNFISTYLSPNDDRMSVIFDPISEYLVSAFDDNLAGYTPGGAEEYWKSEEGYLVKMECGLAPSIYPISLTICGNPVDENTSIGIEEKVNFLPYLKEESSLVAENFEGVSAINQILNTGASCDGPILLTNPYFPPDNTGDNFNMLAGKAYPAIANAEIDYTYGFTGNDEVDIRSILPDFIPNQCTYFKTPFRSSLNMASVILEKEIAEKYLEKGDEIGFFTTQNLLSGSLKYVDELNMIAVLIGDEVSTQKETEGFIQGESILVQIWKAATQKVYNAKIVFKESENRFGKSYYKIEAIEILDEKPAIEPTLQLELFPNPANEKLNIGFELSQHHNNGQIEILSINGQHKITLCNLSLQKGDNILEVNTTNLAAGIYICQLQTERGVVTQKFMISK